MNHSAPQSFLAKNLTLIVGVSLPLVLVLLFWIAMIIPRLTVEAPRYDLVLSSQFYYQEGRQLNGTLAFTVEDGQLFARFNEDPNYPRANGTIPAVAIPVPRLYYFSTGSGSIREIEFSLPQAPEDGALIPIAELSGSILSDENLAPDGYRFDNSYRGSRGFLFLFDGYRYSAKIEKNGRVEKIPAIDQNNVSSGYNFVGWVEQVRTDD